MIYNICMIFSLFEYSDSFEQSIAILFAYFFAIVLALGMHEFAHAYSSYKFGDITAKSQGRLTLNPFKHIDPLGLLSLIFIGFGWAKPVNVNTLKFRNYKLANAVVSISGVATNFILAFVSSGLYFFLTYFVVSTNLFVYMIQYFLQFSILINIGLAVFNLLPIFPLDGFNFIKTFLSYENKFVNFMYRYGSIVLIIFLISPIFDVLYSFITSNILVGFISFWGLFV